LQQTSVYGGPNLAWKKKKKKNSQAASFAASRLAPMTHSFYYCSYPFANTKSFHSKLLVHNAVLHQKILNRVLRHDSKSSKELTWGLSLSLSLSLSILRDHNKMLTTHSTKKIMLKKERRKVCEHHQEQEQQLQQQQGMGSTCREIGGWVGAAAAAAATAACFVCASVGVIT
jgi:hypothetical protein